MHHHRRLIALANTLALGFIIASPAAAQPPMQAPQRVVPYQPPQIHTEPRSIPYQPPQTHTEPRSIPYQPPQIHTEPRSIPYQPAQIRSGPPPVPFQHQGQNDNRSIPSQRQVNTAPHPSSIQPPTTLTAPRRSQPLPQRSQTQDPASNSGRKSQVPNRVRAGQPNTTGGGIDLPPQFLGNRARTIRPLPAFRGEPSQQKILRGEAPASFSRESQSQKAIMVRFNANRNIGLIRPGDGRGAQLGWPNRLQHWHNHPSVNGFALILGIELGEGMFLGYDYWSGCYGYSSNGWSGYNPPGVWIAPDYVVTPWFFDTATGRWYRPGYGYFYNAPSGYYGPVTVTVPEDVWVSEYQDDQGNDVPGHYEIELIVYTAFYVEDWGRWGYRHHDFRRNTDVFVWLNL